MNRSLFEQGPFRSKAHHDLIGDKRPRVHFWKAGKMV
jgi:hypothetical protein